MLLSTGDQRYITKDTGHTEFILILIITPQTPLHHQNGKYIFTGFQVRSNLKFTGGMGYLTKAEEGTVQPDIEAGIDTLEIEVVSLIELLLRYLKAMNIASAGVVFLRNIREVVREGIVDICVLVPVITVVLPTAGNRNIVIAVGVKGREEEVILYLIAVRVKTKLP
jgi:hypothetical protein